MYILSRESLNERGPIRTMTIGLLGCGKQGQKHQYLLESWGHTVVVHDPKYRKHKRLDEVLEEAEAVIIAAPTEDHYHLTRWCLCAEIPVLVEKPLSHTYEQAKNLVSLVEDTRTPLMVNHNERFHPTLQSLTSLRPIQGRIIARRNVGQPGGSLIQRVMIHDIDICNWLFGAMPLSLTATCLDHDYQVRLTYPQGSAFLTSKVGPPMRKMGIFLDQGGHHEIDFLDYHKTLDHSLQSFLSSVQYSKPMPISVEDGAWAVKVMEDIERLLVEQALEA